MDPLIQQFTSPQELSGCHIITQAPVGWMLSSQVEECRKSHGGLEIPVFTVHEPSTTLNSRVVDMNLTGSITLKFSSRIHSDRIGPGYYPWNIDRMVVMQSNESRIFRVVKIPPQPFRFPSNLAPRLF
ncbi:hypothetical protein KQX54_008975 [Cotesia glomerata]|uniref:Uncharacterized protein n=1 Tax=Cotesia glomerata TaxID=32391 RepID=A0AAV7IRD9_COTGL|nr:hypothetical protein KQX54_008975 [Cotesia glomerata]